MRVCVRHLGCSSKHNLDLACAITGVLSSHPTTKLSKVLDLRVEGGRGHSLSGGALVPETLPSNNKVPEVLLREGKLHQHTLSRPSIQGAEGSSQTLMKRSVLFAFCFSVPDAGFKRDSQGHSALKALPVPAEHP